MTEFTVHAMKKICVYKALKKSKTPNPSVLMYLSIPAVYIPQATLGDPHILLPRPPGFTCKFVPGSPGFIGGQIFPEMNENL